MSITERRDSPCAANCTATTYSPAVNTARALAVPPMDDEGIDLVLADVLPRLGTSLLGLELGAAGCLQDGAAALHDVTHILCLEVGDLIGDETLVSTIDTLHVNPVEDGRTGDGTDSGIHARCVAARGENTDAVDSSCHDFKF